MLVLSRKADEMIVVVAGGQRIEVTVIDIRGDKVRLGIDAPVDVSIDREEIYRSKQEQKGED